MADAVKSAIKAVKTFLPDITLVRVEPDDLVTMADIAERLGRSRESVRLLISGARGPGRFPSPISHLKARGRLWLWSEVAPWASKAIGVQAADVASARFVAALNNTLKVRAALSETFGAAPYLPEGSRYVEDIRQADVARQRDLEARRRK